MPRRDIRRDIIPERIVACGVTVGFAKVYKYLVTLGNHLQEGRDIPANVCYPLAIDIFDRLRLVDVIVCSIIQTFASPAVYVALISNDYPKLSSYNPSLTIRSTRLVVLDRVASGAGATSS